jgi:hypothetical protein
MLPWIGQVIIVVQTYFHVNVVLVESSVQYAFEQKKTSPLIVAIEILMDMFMHILSLSSLFVGLLEA